jgi:hypothetical protein
VAQQPRAQLARSLQRSREHSAPDPGHGGGHFLGLHSGGVGIARADRNGARADPGRSEAQAFVLDTEESAQLPDEESVQNRREE